MDHSAIHHGFRQCDQIEKKNAILSAGIRGCYSLSQSAEDEEETASRTLFPLLSIPVYQWSIYTLMQFSTPRSAEIICNYVHSTWPLTVKHSWGILQ